MHKRIELKQNQTILFIGDSITDCQRLESPYAPLGRGYVHFAANFLLAALPQMNLTIQNRGINGDTTRDLKRRWKPDCMALQPDVVSIMIGINDLCRKYTESVEMQQMHVASDEYETNYRKILTQLKDGCGSQLVLMEPFMFCDNPDNSTLVELDAYISITHKLADEFDAALVPLHTAYMALKDKRPAGQWSEDTVHPYTWSHAWIAKQWLAAVIGTA